MDIAMFKGFLEGKKVTFFIVISVLLVIKILICHPQRSITSCPLFDFRKLKTDGGLSSQKYFFEHIDSDLGEIDRVRPKFTKTIQKVG